MTIPTTPTGGEPTADDINTLAHLNSRMLVDDGGSVTIKTADAWRYRQALGRFLADNAKDARVAELEGMLAALHTRIIDIHLEAHQGLLRDSMGNAEATLLAIMGLCDLTQLDKEAGGK